MIKKELEITDFLVIFIRGSWIIAIMLILGASASIGYLKMATPLYEASTLILVEPQRIPEQYVKSTVTFNVNRQLATITHQVLSRTYLETVLDRYPELGGAPDAPIEDRVGAIKKRVEVKVIGDDAFRIFFRGNEPAVVQDVTDMLAGLFIEENLRVREQQADSTAQFLERELEVMKQALEELEAQLRAFKEEHMGELPEQLEANLRALDRLQEESAQIDASIGQLIHERSLLRKELDSALARNQTEESDVTVDPLEAELRRKETDLAQYLQLYTEKHPDVIRLRQEVRYLKRKLASRQPTLVPADPAAGDPIISSSRRRIYELDSEIARRRTERERVEEQIRKYQQRVENTPRLEQQMATLQRDYNNTRSNYLSLLNKRLEARLARNMEIRQQGMQFRVLDKARFPTKPVKPNPFKILVMGIGGALGAGLGIVFGLAYLDRKIRSAEDLALVTDAKFIGEISKL